SAGLPSHLLEGCAQAEAEDQVEQADDDDEQGHGAHLAGAEEPHDHCVEQGAAERLGPRIPWLMRCYSLTP
ncbi:hypothetical protein, partial [Citrobacter freundii]|uniref:hypothetical protein n=1 Tax=Citrobacter freundii TaxID=546 RepID=UPI0019540DD5